MQPDDDRPFCRHCGDRLPKFGAGLRFCPSCAARFPGVLGVVRDSARASLKSSLQSRKDPLLAALLSVLLPGAGQLYLGHFIFAALIFVTSPFVIPWIIGVVHAYFAAERVNRAQRNDDRAHGAPSPSVV